MKEGVTLYGTATVGTKGQIVIPAEARESMNIQPGDKVMIIGHPKKRAILGVCTEESLQDLINHLDKKLDTLRTAVDTSSKESKK
ncbi:AbrB/MazE/SpoVT family DNA-binding domain-containing protein [Candidatus Saccharibacteria bacterium]|nr:AbrB/MazE/SpoVT family DNA-binding domain-containing protein [Candidatus Saccharibacteria bacterium]